MAKKIVLCLLVIFCFSVVGCGQKDKTEKEEPVSEETDNSKEGEVLQAGETLEANDTSESNDITDADDTSEAGGGSKEDEERPMFPWRDLTMSVLYALDDDTIKNGSNQPEGKYVQVFLKSVDGTIPWEQLTDKYKDFSVRDLGGKEYKAVAAGFSSDEEGGVDIRDLDKVEYSGVYPMFDVPKDVMLDDLTLLVKTEKDSETITVKIADVPHEAPEDK